jgi:hypothetical protein
MGKTIRALFGLALASAAYSLYTRARSSDGAPSGDRLPERDDHTTTWPESGAEAHPQAAITDLPDIEE